MTTDTEALKALVALAQKATAGEWVVHQRKTPFHSAAIPEYEIPEHCGEHIENIVTTDWLHPQLKDVLVINNIGYGLPKEPGEPRADLISMSEDDAAFIAAARNAIPALERMLASQMGARELGLKWGRHDGRGEYHIEWHAPCGCAYHPEPKPHIHPCIKHSEIDPCHDL